MDEHRPLDHSLRLSDSHRRYIRALVGEMRELVDVLRRKGVSVEVSAEVVSRVEHLEQALVLAPLERGDVAGAAVSRLWVLACELRAKSVQGYGELGSRERAFLDRQSELLEQSVRRLGKDIGGSRVQEPSLSSQHSEANG